MLHAKDLMIGDWVFCIYPSINKPVKVAGLKTVSDDEMKIVVCDDDITLVFQERYFEPIPITPEILEKNGFIVRTAYTVPKWHIGLYGRDDSDITLNIYSEKKQEWRLSIETNRNERTVCYINNVHELQHALRLCGIEKEIEL